MSAKAAQVTRNAHFMCVLLLSCRQNPHTCFTKVSSDLTRVFMREAQDQWCSPGLLGSHVQRFFEHQPKLERQPLMSCSRGKSMCMLLTCMGVCICSSLSLHLQGQW